MRSILFLLAILAAPAPQSTPVADADGALAELSKVTLDKASAIKVRDITLRRDALSVTLNRGVIMFFTPVRGRVTGAVFLGSGEVVALPSDRIERENLSRFAGTPVLNESFNSAFLRFTDETFQEIVREHAEHSIEDVTAEEIAGFEPWHAIVSERAATFSYRILMDMIGRSDQPLFFAELHGERLGWFNAVFDQRLVEEVMVVQAVEANQRAYVDTWASFNKRSEVRDPEKHAHEVKVQLDILSYDIDATIHPDTRLDAKAVVRARALSGGDRVITFDLSRFLRLTDVRLSDQTQIPYYQYANLTEDELRRYGVNICVIVLPTPIQVGEEITLEFNYSGDVIEERGRGVFFVGERGLWYPNLGHQDRARFHMTFHYPSNYSLVATGERLREWEDGGRRHAEFSSGEEYPVAGFNLGDFTIVTEQGSPNITVSLNNDVETVYKEVAARRAFQRESAIRAAASIPRRGASPTLDSMIVAPDYSVFSTKSLGEAVLQEVRGTVNFMTEALGPFPYANLTVSQFPVNYSQGWPTLLYVSTLSFFNKEQREKLGLRSESDFMITELVRAHEIAHQWFGNQVGWRGYRDQWISEGFANYLGAMYLDNKYPNSGKLPEILGQAREKLLEKLDEKRTKESIGPISLGSRLSTSRAPDGYLEAVYNKGTWVVHMLRMLMRDSGKDPDAPFRAMLRDFVSSNRGKVVSTWDFQRLVERHMNKGMDLQSDRKLDWFFDQWVRGTGIPSYELDYKITPGTGGFIVEGSIKQSGVDDSFTMPVPVAADYGSRVEILGRVIVTNDDGQFKFVSKAKPVSLKIDPENTILRLPED